MNILYIAYSCDPYNGSEDKIGWNIPVESAKNNRVFVLTKEEHREAIKKYLSQNSIKNIRFFFIDIPLIYKRLFKGFLYSGRLNIWNKRAYSVARTLCKQENIDIIHQITPIEFRSIGNYGKIPDIKFVCGPLGGGEDLPKGLESYAKGHIAIEIIRSFVNKWYRLQLKSSGKLNHCSYLMFANQETRDFLLSGNSLTACEIYFDNGLNQEEIKDKTDKDIHSTTKCLNFLAAGRMIYRKGYDFLLDALENLPNDLNYQCRIVGDGPEFEHLKVRCSYGNLQKKVVLTGRITYADMPDEYSRADIFLMPSVRETTGAVLLEAMANALPVVALNRFGSAILFDEETGWLYDGNTTEEFIEAINNAIVFCVNNPEEVIRKGKNANAKAKLYTWTEKVNYYNGIYNRLIEKKGK